MSADIVEVQDIASAIVQGDGTIRRIRGCNVAGAAGVYVVTINPNNLAGPELAAAESVSKVNVVGFATLNAELVHTSPTVKTITLRNAANVVTGSEFSFRLGRLLG